MFLCHFEQNGRNMRTYLRMSGENGTREQKLLKRRRTRGELALVPSKKQREQKANTKKNKEYC